MKLISTNLLTFILLFISIQLGNAQVGQCPYPVIFVHGWTGSSGSWDPTYANADYAAIWGGGSLPDDKIFWVMPNATDTHVYDACCLFCITSTCLNDNKRNDNINGPNGTWQGTGSGADDVQWIFTDEDNVLSAGCNYAVSFNTGKNSNGTVMRNPSITSTAPCSDCSDNNEAAVVKQGYALKKAIEAVLAANPTKKKVILVGHSMGGLCIREYLQRTTGTGAPRWWVDPSAADGHKVARVMTAGTPHRGSNTLEFKPTKGEEAGRNSFQDLSSEAVRDLRYMYGENNKPGPYLFGGLETNVPFNDYHSEDVNCDGDTNDNVVGINQAGSPNGWDGTRDNPSMPLPLNVRYTWFVTNQVGGILSTCKYQNYGCAGDGVVDDERQWIYTGSGQGRTEDYVDGVNIPAPSDGVAHRLADRITSENRTFHTSQPGDIDYHIHGIDEGDYPKFAWEINTNTTYAGIVQLPADLRPNDSNRAINQDKDWYVVTLPSATRGFKVMVKPNSDRAGRIDVYDAPSDYLTGNSTTALTFAAGTSTTQTVKSIACYAANQKIYIRVTHNGIARADWKKPFTIRVEPTTVEIPTAIGVYTATGETTTSDGWTHYWKDASAAPVTTNDLLLLSIKKDATVVIPTNKVTHGVNLVGGATNLTSAAYNTSGNYWFVMNRYWFVDPTTQPSASGVDVRFYYMNYDFTGVQSAVVGTGGTLASHADLKFYKFATNSLVDPNPSLGHIGGTSANFLTPTHINNVCITDNYAEMHIAGFSGGGGGGGGQGLPVELMSFEGKKKERTVELTWKTASENNTSHFEIERAINSVRFENIGKTPANGNSSSALNYQFIDQKPQIGRNYYRLKMVDKDGTFEYSKVVEVRFSDKKAIAIQLIKPNPVKNELTMEFEAERAGNVNIHIIDAIGRQIFKTNFSANEGTNNFIFNTESLSSGVYYMQLQRNEDGMSDVSKFIKE